jgi:hypothetical protein
VGALSGTRTPVQAHWGLWLVRVRKAGVLGGRARRHTLWGIRIRKARGLGGRVAAESERRRRKCDVRVLYMADGTGLAREDLLAAGGKSRPPTHWTNRCAAHWSRLANPPIHPLVAPNLSTSRKSIPNLARPLEATTPSPDLDHPTPHLVSTL